mgnify:CR=1 FL=1
MHMSSIADNLPTDGKPLNLSRRRFLGGSMGALVLGVLLPSEVLRAAQSAVAEIKPGTRIPAFLEIRPDGTALLRCPFVEGGQGLYTAFAQIVGEELDTGGVRGVEGAGFAGFEEWGALSRLATAWWLISGATTTIKSID